MATTVTLQLKDGTLFEVGQVLRHRKHGYEGTLEEIRICEGPDIYAPRLRIKPFDLDHPKLRNGGWPVEGGGFYIPARDSGLPVKEWEITGEVQDEEDREKPEDGLGIRVFTTD